MLDKVLRDDVEAVPERHEGYGLLAEYPIWLPDDRSLEHPGMGVEDVLDLLRVDVLPAPDDQVLDPVDQGEVAVVVEPADVAGVQPSAAQRLGRLLPPAEVAAHDVRAADDHLAGLPGRQQRVGPVHHTDVDAGQRPAHATRLAEAVQRVGGAADRAFRQPVAFHDGYAEPLLELADQLAGHRGGAADDEAQAPGVRRRAGT